MNPLEGASAGVPQADKVSDAVSEAVFSVRWGSATHRGHAREVNEDSAMTTRPVFLVADGMGGHDAGDMASLIVVNQFRALTGRPWLDVAGLHAAVEAADAQIRGLPSATDARPGTTLTGVGLTQQGGTPCWLVFNVGDSRTYRFSERGLEQISVDHSQVQELIDAGRLSADDPGAAKGRNVITRAIGVGEPHPPVLDKWLLVAAPGDRMLVCTDGLTDAVSDEVIAQVLLRYADPGAAACQLVELALDAGGRDNITCVVVDAADVRGHGPASSAVDSAQTTTLIGSEP